MPAQPDHVSIVLALLTLACVGVGGLCLIILRVLAWQQHRRAAAAASTVQTATTVLKRRLPERKTNPYQHLSDIEVAEAALELAEQRQQRIEDLEEQLTALLERLPDLPTKDTWNWLQALVDSLHLLIIGHSRGGKTTLIHEIAVRRAKCGERVIVCDPDAAPGMWPGCEVVGYGNDFAAINKKIVELSREMEERRQLRGSGQRRSFAPVHLVIDEYADVVRECEAAQAAIEDGLRRWGKLNGHLVLGVQDKQVKTMRLEGQGDLRNNFAYVAEVRRQVNQREALITTGSGERVGTYPVPDLVDPESLITPAAPVKPAPTEAKPTKAPKPIETAVTTPKVTAETKPTEAPTKPAAPADTQPAEVKGESTADAERLLERLFAEQPEPVAAVASVPNKPTNGNGAEQHHNGAEHNIARSEHAPDTVANDPQPEQSACSENSIDPPITPEELEKLGRALRSLSSGKAGGKIDAIYYGWGLKRGGGPKYKRAELIFETAQGEQEKSSEKE